MWRLTVILLIGLGCSGEKDDPAPRTKKSPHDAMAVRAGPAFAADAGPVDAALEPALPEGTPDIEVPLPVLE